MNYVRNDLGPSQHANRNSAYLRAGVHDDKVLAVEPQEDWPREDQLTHFQYHIHSVAKEGQLGCGLCG